jgi:hypothetical protein
MNRTTFTPFVLAVALLAGLTLIVPAQVAHAADDAFGTIAEQAEPIRLSLMRDSLDMVGDAAARIERAADDLAKADSATAGVEPAKLADVHQLAVEMRSAARALAAAATADSVDDAREALASLSKPLARWHGLKGGDETFAVAYCPMVRKSWIQPADEEIGNPYDSTMPTCGSFVGG